MLVALLLQAAVPDAAAFIEVGQLARISRSVALRHTTEEIVISHIVNVLDATRLMRLRLITYDAEGRQTEHSTDTVRCTPARDIVARLAEAPMPRPDLPREPRPTDLVFIADGLYYSVTLPVGYGRGSLPETATFSSNVGTPLATWIEERFSTLRPCWPDAALLAFAFSGMPGYAARFPYRPFSEG